jgi:hypothetical protein
MDGSGIPSVESPAATPACKTARRKSRVLMQKVQQKKGTADKDKLKVKRFLSRQESKRFNTSSEQSTARFTTSAQISNVMQEAKKIRDNLSIHKLREQDITSLSLRIAAASLSRSCALPSAHMILNMVCERAQVDLKRDTKLMEMYKQEHVEDFFRTTDYGEFKAFGHHYTHFLQHYMALHEPKKTKDIRKVQHLAMTHTVKAMSRGIRGVLDDNRHSHGPKASKSGSSLSPSSSSSSSPTFNATAAAPTAAKSSRHAGASAAVTLEHWYGEMDKVPGTKRVMASRKQRNHWEWPTVLGQNITRGSGDAASTLVKQPSIQPDPTGKAFWVRDIGAGHGDGALQFNAPTGIDVLTDGLEEGVGAIARIAIADTGNHRVQMATLHARSELQLSATEISVAEGTSASPPHPSSSYPASAAAPTTANKDSTGKDVVGRRNEVYLFEGLLGSDSLFSGKTGSHLEAPISTTTTTTTTASGSPYRPDDPRLKNTAGRRMGQFTSPRMVSFSQQKVQSGSKPECVYVSDNSLAALMGHPRIQEFHVPSRREQDTAATLSGFIDNCSHPKVSLERALINPVHGVTVAGSTHFVFTDCGGRPTCPPKKDRLFVTVEKKKLLESLIMEADASRTKAKELQIKAEVHTRWKRKRYLHPNDWRNREESELKRELDKMKEEVALQKEAEAEAKLQEATRKAAQVEEEMSKHSFRIREADGKIIGATGKKYGSLKRLRKDYKMAKATVSQRGTSANDADDSNSDSGPDDATGGVMNDHGSALSLDGQSDGEWDDKLKHGGSGANYEGRRNHHHRHHKVPDMVTGFAWTFPRAMRPLDLETSMLSCLGAHSQAGRSVRGRVEGWFDILNRDNDYDNAVYTSRRDRVQSLGHDRWKADYALGVEIDQCMASMMPSLLKMVLPETDFKKYSRNLRNYNLAGDVPEDVLNKAKKGQKNSNSNGKSGFGGRASDVDAQDALARTFYDSHPLRVEWQGIIHNLRADLSAALVREELPTAYQKEIQTMSNAISVLPDPRMPSHKKFSSFSKASQKSKEDAEGKSGLLKKLSKKFSLRSPGSLRSISSMATVVSKTSNLRKSTDNKNQAERTANTKQAREDARRDWNLEVQHKLVNLACLARFVRDMEAIAEVRRTMREKKQRVDEAKVEMMMSERMVEQALVDVEEPKEENNEEEAEKEEKEEENAEESDVTAGGEAKSSAVKKKEKKSSLLVPGSNLRTKDSVTKGKISTRNLPGLATKSYAPVEEALRAIFWFKMEGKVKEMISEIMFERFNSYLRIYDQLEDTYLFQTSDSNLRLAAEQPMSQGITTADRAISAQIRKYDESGWQIRRDVIKRGNEDSAPSPPKIQARSSHITTTTSSSSSSSSSKNKGGWWAEQKQGVDTFTLVEVPRSSIRGKSMQAYITPNPRHVGMWIDGTVVGLDRERGLYVFEHQSDACCEFMDKMERAKERDRKQKEMDKISSDRERPSSPIPIAAAAAMGDNKPKRRILLVARTHLREKPPVARGLFSKPWGTAQTQSNGNEFLVVSDYDLGCVHFFDTALIHKEDESLINSSTLNGSSGRSAAEAGGEAGAGGVGGEDSASFAAEMNGKDGNDRKAGGGPPPSSYSNTSTSDVTAAASAGAEVVVGGGENSAKQKDRRSPYLYTVGTMGKQRGQLRGPKGMCFDPANRLIVADCLNNRIQCFEYVPRARGGAVDISLHPSIGNHQGNGRWECCFTYPEHPVAFGKSDLETKKGKEDEDTYVKFAGHSAAISHVDHATQDQPSLHCPSDVCVDAFGNILVADTGNQCIRILRTRVYYGPHYPVDPGLVDSSEAWMFEKTLKGQFVRTWPYTYVECIATWGCRGFLEGQLVEPVAITTYSVPIKYASQTLREKTQEEDGARRAAKAGNGAGGGKGTGRKIKNHTSPKGHKKGKHKRGAAMHGDVADATTTKVMEFREQRYLVVDKGKHCVTEFSVTPPDFVWNASQALKNTSARDFAEPHLGNLGLPGTARRRAIEARNKERMMSMKKVKKAKKGKKR